MNECMFIGRLVRNPAVKDGGDNGKPSVSFTVAVNRPYRKGSDKDEADSIYFIAYQPNQVEHIRKHFEKGDLIRVSASYRQYTPQGSKERKHFFHVDRVHFVPGKRRDGSIETGSGPDHPISYDDMTGISDDDIPF